jgi:TPR repeat protein
LGYIEEKGDTEIGNIVSLSIIDQEDNATELSPPPSSSSSSEPYAYPPRPQQPRSTFTTYFESDTISIVISDAKEGNKHAQFALGERHRLGKGVLQDDRVALMWILKAAHQGEGAAQYQAGQMYEEGCGTRKDLALAMGWYQKAAEKCVADSRERYARLRGMNYS